jgi:Domain of unknown function (DUF6429)
MTPDSDKIDRAVLALLYLGLHDVDRAWKGFDWETMNRLHEKGFISDPRGKAKSVAFTEEQASARRDDCSTNFSRATSQVDSCPTMRGGRDQ